jgi:hypothetical protein
MIRRHPDAVLAAHRMDPARRELYVEGKRDRFFLSWLLGSDLPAESSVREIAFVEIPNVSGGERGRLIQFAHSLADHNVRIRMFADADWDRVLKKVVPERVWLTDHRDLEGYLLRVECIDKVLRLGVVTDQIAAESLLRVVKENCKRLGILRLLSECEGLNLPFQSTSLRRFLKTKKGEFTLDFDRYLRALLQNAGISLRELKPLRSRLTQLEAQYADTADTELIHGKDATCIIEAALLKCGVREEEGRRLLWCSFEARLVEPGSTLASVLAFVRAGGVGS